MLLILPCCGISEDEVLWNEECRKATEERGTHDQQTKDMMDDAADKSLDGDSVGDVSLPDQGADEKRMKLSDD